MRTRILISVILFWGFVAAAIGQQQYVGPAEFVKPLPPVVPQIDCRVGSVPLDLEEPESKVVPALTFGHVGRFVSQTSPCIRVDYWVPVGGKVQLTYFSKTGEAFEANQTVAPNATFAQAFLRDTFGNVRGNIFIRAVDGGCSRLYVRAVIDGEVEVPFPPADLEQFVRYVSAPNNPCVP